MPVSHDPIVVQVLEIMGGPGRGAVGRVAKLLKLKHQTVYAWLRKGRIPRSWQVELLRVARERGLPLEPKHFFYAEEPAKPATARPPERGSAWAA